MEQSATIGNYRDLQITALETTIPLLTNTLLELFKDRMRKTTSIAQMGELVRDIGAYMDDVCVGKIYGPYQFAINNSTERDERGLDLDSLGAMLDLEKEYDSFASFVAHVHQKSGRAVAPLSRYFEISNRTLIRFINNVRDPPTFIAARTKRASFTERPRNSILKRLTISPEAKEKLKGLPMYRHYQSK